MNCKDAEKMMLLADSGELSSAKEKALEQHMASCELCRAFRADTKRLMTVSAAASAEPSAKATRKVALAAAARVSGGGRRNTSLVYQTFAYAAAFMIMVTGWYMIWSTESTGENRVAELSAIITFSSEDEGLIETADNDAALDELAEQLLTMQGFNEEVILEYPDEEPAPTALQLRSTHGPLSKKCV